MEFLAENWVAIAGVVFFAASEIIGMSKLKDNSVVQMIMSGVKAALDGAKGKTLGK